MPSRNHVKAHKYYNKTILHLTLVPEIMDYTPETNSKH